MFKSKKLIFSLLLAFAMFSLVSCSAQEEIGIIGEEFMVPEETKYVQAELGVGDFETLASSSVSIVYAYDDEIYFDSEGYIEEIFVSSGDYVEEGEVIASYTTGGSQVTLEEKKMELERMESSYESAVDSYNSTMDVENKILANLESGSYEYELQKLNIEKSQIAQKEYVYTTLYSIEQLEEEIAELEETLDVQYILAPFDGEMIKVESLSVGKKVEANTLIGQIASTDKIFFYVESSTKFQLGDTVDIQVGTNNNMVQLSGTVISDDSLLSSDIGSFGCYIKIDYENSEVDEEYDYPDNLSIKAYVQEVYMPDVLLLDDSAVEKDGTSLYVYILEDSVVKKRYITSTYYNTDYYWIEDGIAADQTVVIE